MKFQITHSSILFGAALVLTLIIAASASHAQGTVVAEAVPSNATPARGATITVNVNIDVSATDPEKLLGSFTGSLRWDRELLKYESHDGTKAPFTGVVNVFDAGGLGEITFNGANANGAAGKSNVLTVTFTAISPNGITVELDLEFTAMLAALDFTNLMPLLTVTDGAIVTAVSAEDVNLPTDFALDQNYPNPFNPETTIGYALPQKSDVRMTIFNTLGQLVRIVDRGVQPAGRHRLQWDGRNHTGEQVSSGVYYYQITAGSFSDVRKMLLIR
jgi:hypothetical protein